MTDNEQIECMQKLMEINQSAMRKLREEMDYRQRQIENMELQNMALRHYAKLLKKGADT